MIRGLMIDCARLVERHGFYHDLIETLAASGYNTLWWHFVDDQGFVLRSRSRPEVSGAYAFSHAEVRRLVEHASELGIDVVPEVETLGHARWATRLPRYAHLADGDPHLFNAMCPSRPETMALLDDIINETCELFPSPYFHAGLDEVNLSGCPRCDARRAGKPAWHVFAEHVKAIHRMVTDRGKRMLMWADHVAGIPELLDGLPRDIVMVHWQYRQVDEAQIRRSLGAGFEVSLVPWVLKHGDMVRANDSWTENLAQTLSVAHRLDGALLGIVQSWWWPQRAVRGACLPMVALTGRALGCGKLPEPNRFYSRWARRAFGCDDKALGRAVARLHRQGLVLGQSCALFATSLTDVVRALELAGRDDADDQHDEAADIVTALASCSKHVVDRRDIFDALHLAARVILQAHRNGRRLADFQQAMRRAQWYHDLAGPAERCRPYLDEAAEHLRELVAEMAELRDGLFADWNRTRHPRDAKKTLRDRDHVTQHTQHLAARVASSTGFFEAWHRRFVVALGLYLGGGAFPALWG